MTSTPRDIKKKKVGKRLFLNNLVCRNHTLFDLLGDSIICIHARRLASSLMVVVCIFADLKIMGNSRKTIPPSHLMTRPGFEDDTVVVLFCLYCFLMRRIPANRIWLFKGQAVCLSSLALDNS